MTNTTEMIETAVRDERTIVFTYNGEKRTVKPESVNDCPVHSTNKHKHFLIGFDYDRDDHRRFHLDQMLEVTVQ